MFMCVCQHALLGCVQTHIQGGQRAWISCSQSCRLVATQCGCRELPLVLLESSKCRQPLSCFSLWQSQWLLNRQWFSAWIRFAVFGILQYLEIFCSSKLVLLVLVGVWGCVCVCACACARARTRSQAGRQANIQSHKRKMNVMGSCFLKQTQALYENSVT